MRLLGVGHAFHSRIGYTEDELETCTKILNLRDELLASWDQESAKLGLKPGNRTRCNGCGKYRKCKVYGEWKGFMLCNECWESKYKKEYEESEYNKEDI